MADETVDYEAMNDADFSLEEDIPFTEPIESDESGEDTDEDTDEDTNDDVDVDEDTGEPADDDEDSDDLDDDDNLDEDTDEDDEDDADDDTVDEDDDQAELDGEDTDTSDGEDETDTDDDANDIDFEAGYKEIMAPFKANGKEMTLDNIDDVRRLLSMGVGFSEKMRVLKPHLKIIKSLKDNGLLDQDKLNHLIDVSRKDPKAIAKLIKDGGIDPLDIKTEEAGEYEPKSYEVSDTAFDLDQAIESIRGNESFDESMKVMGDQWDQKSKNLIAENPGIVGIIDNHIQSGIFEKVQSYVTKEKALGRMGGLSDVEAYRNGVDALKESGVLTADGSEETKDKSKTNKKVNPLEAEAKKKKAAKAKAKKKSAAPTKATAKKKGAKKGDNFDDLNDEDFLKQFG